MPVRNPVLDKCTKSKLEHLLKVLNPETKAHTLTALDDSSYLTRGDIVERITAPFPDLVQKGHPSMKEGNIGDRLHSGMDGAIQKRRKSGNRMAYRLNPKTDIPYKEIASHWLARSAEFCEKYGEQLSGLFSNLPGTVEESSNIILVELLLQMGGADKSLAKIFEGVSASYSNAHQQIKELAAKGLIMQTGKDYGVKINEPLYRISDTYRGKTSAALNSDNPTMKFIFWHLQEQEDYAIIDDIMGNLNPIGTKPKERKSGGYVKNMLYALLEKGAIERIPAKDLLHYQLTEKGKFLAEKVLKPVVGMLSENRGYPLVHADNNQIYRVLAGLERIPSVKTNP